MAKSHIYVNQLEVYGYIGVSEEERKIGHRLILNLEMAAWTPASETDHIQGTIDYAEAAALANRLVSDTKCQTLERLAQVIANALFAQFSTLDEVIVTILKPLPPMPLVAESVGVKCRFQR